MSINKIENWFDIENGVKLWHELNKYRENLSNLKDGRYYILVERIENIRSRKQNNAMWAIPYMYFKQALIESGEFVTPSKEDIHEWCMLQFLPSDYRERIYEEWKNKALIVNRKTGEMYKQPFRLTTTRMTTKDANNYYEAMQNGYAEYFSKDENDFIPDPEKNWKNKTK
jgi:hypothetical protein